MANIIATAQKIQEGLDELFTQGLVTGWMDANSNDVEFTGADTVRIPSIDTNGLTDYNEATGFDGTGAVKFTYEEYRMEVDRGQDFSFDERKVDETNYELTMARTMAHFQKYRVQPEMDAYRISKLAQTAIAQNNAEYSYTPSSNDIVKNIKHAITQLKSKGFYDIVIHATWDVVESIEDFLLDRMQTTNITINGVNLACPVINGATIIPTDDIKMYTKIKLEKGTDAGYSKATDGKDINFIAIGRKVPCAPRKIDAIRIFTPETNQKARAWKADYRIFHDLVVKKSNLNGVFVNIKDAQ